MVLDWRALVQAHVKPFVSNHVFCMFAVDKLVDLLLELFASELLESLSREQKSA